MDNAHGDFYRKLRDRITAFLRTPEGSSHPWADVLLLGPDLFHLLARLVRDDRVPRKHKLRLGAALIYFLSPIEFLPEALIGPIGFLDDIAFAAYALHSVVNEIDPAILREHWAGDGDLLETLRKTLSLTQRFLGRGIWGKVARRFGFKDAA